MQFLKNSLHIQTVFIIFTATETRFLNQKIYTNLNH